METSVWIIVISTIAIALIFDIINGFHDAANSIATVVSTRVLSPRFAVLWAAFFNFSAMFFFAPKVASSISKIIIINASEPAFVYVVLSALIGAITWDLVTWYWGLPTSSSHALIGGLTGSGFAYGGIKIIHWDIIAKTASFIPLAPLVGLSIAFIIMVAVYWIFRKWRPLAIDNLFRKGQLFSAALYSLGHGGNDAQKTMGIIVAVLLAAGLMSPGTELSLDKWDTLWIILSCNIAMAIGTAMGGWKIVKTMGMKLTKMKPVHGFCAETAGAITLYFVTALGIPVSTTHTIAGSIVGVGMTMSLSGIKWLIAIRIIVSWIITIPCSALIAALSFWLIRAMHPGF